MKRLIINFFKWIDKHYYKKQNPKDIRNKYSDVKVLSDLVYDEDSYLDLYYDGQTKDKEIVINIHGGGFVAGAKENRDCLCRYIAKEANKVVLNVEHKKADKYSFIQTIIQLSKILDFIADKKDKYQYNLDKIAIHGDSSGAFYALSLAVLSTSREYQDKFNIYPKIAIKKVITDCVIGDFHIQSNNLISKMIMPTLLKMVSKENITNIDESVNKDKAQIFEYVNNKQEYLVCYSKNDIFCNGQSEKLISILKERKIKYQEFSSNKKKDTHVFPIMWVGDKAEEFNKILIRFLKS